MYVSLCAFWITECGYMLCHMLKHCRVFSSLYLGPSGNFLCSQILIIHGVGHQGAYLHCHLSQRRFLLCPADALTLALESTPFLQGERQMSYCSALRFSCNYDPLVSYTNRWVWQFIWQLPNCWDDLEKNESGECRDFGELFSCNTVQTK